MSAPHRHWPAAFLEKANSTGRSMGDNKRKEEDTKSNPSHFKAKASRSAVHANGYDT